ncbi:MAG: SRPBCC family protein [Steroidobacteraceae bacterium]
MASIVKEMRIKASPERVWDALRDVGALHTRLAPGFVVDVRMDGEARIVTFGNGAIAREEIVDVNDAIRRVAWAIVGGKFLHYNATAQVFADGHGATRFVWSADVLPNDLGAGVAAMIEAGLSVIKKTMESSAAPLPN